MKYTGQTVVLTAIAVIAMAAAAYVAYQDYRQPVPVLADIYDCNLPQVHPLRRTPGGAVVMACELDTVPPDDLFCEYRVTTETVLPLFYCDVE